MEKEYFCGICGQSVGRLTRQQASEWFEWWRLDEDEQHDTGIDGGGKLVCRDCVADHFENCEI